MQRGGWFMLRVVNKIFSKSFLKPLVLAVGLSVAATGAPVTGAWNGLATGLVIGGAAVLLTSAAIATGNRYYYNNGYYNNGYYYPRYYNTGYYYRGQCTRQVVKCAKHLRYNPYTGQYYRACWTNYVPC